MRPSISVRRWFFRGAAGGAGRLIGTPSVNLVLYADYAHPVQSFQWGDYTARAGTTYRYRVVPVYGKPKLIELDDASATTVEITTELEQVRTGNEAQPAHDVYFNRGVAGSQAYARKFATQEAGTWSLWSLNTQVAAPSVVE